MTEQERERMFQKVVGIAYDATGGNCAFEPEYGMYYLNPIRVAMGLRPVVSDDLKADIATMNSLL